MRFVPAGAALRTGAGVHVVDARAVMKRAPVMNPGSSPEPVAVEVTCPVPGGRGRLSVLGHLAFRPCRVRSQEFARLMGLLKSYGQSLR